MSTSAKSEVGANVAKQKRDQNWLAISVQRSVHFLSKRLHAEVCCCAAPKQHMSVHLYCGTPTAHWGLQMYVGLQTDQNLGNKPT